MRDFIRRHQLGDPFFLFFIAYFAVLGIAGCWINSDEKLANAVQHAIERPFK